MSKAKVPKFPFDVKWQIHHGQSVHTHAVMDALRKEHCLCLNCGWLESGCPAANALYGTCKHFDMALAVTRCPDFVP